MPSVSPEQELQYLDAYIKRLVGIFGREAIFTIDDLYSAGGTTRNTVGDKVYLPPDHAALHLLSLQDKGLITVSQDANRNITFMVTILVDQNCTHQ